MKPKLHADGRISFPGVVRYAYGGATHDLPPLDGTAFVLDILDLPAYEDLARSGLLYHPRHTGSTPAVTDNRRTS